MPEQENMKEDETWTTVKTIKGWYYISHTRYRGRVLLWVGPFLSEDEALKDAREND